VALHGQQTFRAASRDADLDFGEPCEAFELVGQWELFVRNAFPKMGNPPHRPRRRGEEDGRRLLSDGGRLDSIAFISIFADRGNESGDRLMPIENDLQREIRTLGDRAQQAIEEFEQAVVNIALIACVYRPRISISSCTRCSKIIFQNA
jgi:hypothetical protein